MHTQHPTRLEEQRDAPLQAESEPAWDEAEQPERSTLEDSIQLYLREIGQVSLLTAEQEVALAQRIERGQLARAQLEAGCTPAERPALEALVADGAQARQELIQANLRLVVSVAKRYIGHQMSFLDLVQEGNLGLMRAVDKFDWRKGNRFSTYATWWIRQAVSRSLAEHGRLIRLPVHLGEMISQVRRTMQQLEQALERPPTEEELAAALGISVRKVKRLLTAAIAPISLEQPTGPDGDTFVGEMLADEAEDGPMETATQNLLYQDVHAALEALPERERQVLALRYGLQDGRRRTLEEVGAAFGITRERTRQIEAEAMRRLRAPEVGRRLQGYLE
ncbi:sigma-70 family RNA polymerase sigma factor [Kallotenue papyrolyticum]|uniref:sigma-70 family RNA polymerase sigma factor n=1 Tax=Kallotenue papyrolyticum TaxID=1325125 RepID=UPI00047867D3|nr:sigma-70 family RNA polymerase sigma factor [Kallotenue papyrolyticum]